MSKVTFEHNKKANKKRVTLDEILRDRKKNIPKVRWNRVIALRHYRPRVFDPPRPARKLNFWLIEFDIHGECPQYLTSFHNM